jgi:tight adherence protein B
VSRASILALVAGALGACAVAELVMAGGDLAQKRGRGVARQAGTLVDAVVRLGSEGRAPGAAERRRLLAAGALLALLMGTLLAGPAVGAALAAAGPWAIGRVLAARREHYRREVDRGAAAAALAMADALGAGHSLRGALLEAAVGLRGGIGHELRRVATELAAGARTDDAFEGMRARVRSSRLDTIVAACLVQRRAGGDLARLLRECAESFGDQDRLEDEVRSATAQARFTGVVVVLLPLGGALLAELADPGFIAGLWGSFLTAWLVGLALALQVVAAVAIRRLGRVRW